MKLLDAPSIVKLHGVELHAISERACVEFILSRLDAGIGGWVVTHNLDHLRRLMRDRAFTALCSRADLRVADGMPLVWACRLQGTPVPERVAGSNLIISLSRAAAERHRSIFLLGGNDGSAEAAAEALKACNPDLRVAGTFCPPMGFEEDEASIAGMIAAIRSANPDVVYVALGSPKQEIWIDRLRDVAPAAWWIGVGISFSFLAGEVRRAPHWVQESGLEWAHRLVQEPRRLSRRYIVDGVPFAARVLASSALGRVSQSHE